jgi:hypothetical protein
MNQSSRQPAVGATGGTGGNGGNGGLIIGNGATGAATPKPPSTMYSGVGPLPANDAKAPTSVGATGAATPKPPSTMYSGVGPLPANDAKAPTSVGASQREQANAQALAERQPKKLTTNIDEKAEQASVELKAIKTQKELAVQSLSLSK